MASGGYYLGGDRDDPSNYSHRVTNAKAASNLLNTEQTINKNEIKKIIKDNFNIDLLFFYDKLKDLNPSSRDYWDLKTFLSFAKSTKNFYAQAMSLFYEIVFKQKKTFGYDESINGLKQAIEKQIECETYFIQQFNRSGRDCLAFINKLAKSRLVLDLSAKAWIISHTIAAKANLNIQDCGDIVKCSILINSALKDCKPNLDLEIYRNAKSMQKRFTNLKFNTFLKDNHPSELYCTQSAVRYLNELLTLSQGVRTEELPEIIYNVKQNLIAKNLEQFVAFYDNYAKINYIINKLKNAGASNLHPMDLFEDEDGNDLFIFAINYQKLCNQLLAKSEALDYRYINDIKFVNNLLSEIISDSAVYYKDYVAYCEELKKKINKIFNDDNKKNSP